MGAIEYGPFHWLKVYKYFLLVFFMHNIKKKFKKIDVDGAKWLLRFLGIFYIRLDAVDFIFNFDILFVIT